MSSKSRALRGVVSTDSSMVLRGVLFLLADLGEKGERMTLRAVETGLRMSKFFLGLGEEMISVWSWLSREAFWPIVGVCV